MSPLLIFFSFVSPLLLLCFILFSKKNKGRRLPPSPPKLPIIGNLHQIGTLPHRVLWELAQKYGPLMYLMLGSSPTIVVSSAKMAQEVLKGQDLSFASRPDLAFSRLLIYNSSGIVLAPYGQYWRQVKRITVLHLLSAKKVQSFRHIWEEEIALKMDKFINGSPNGLVDVSRMLISWTNDIISRVALGKTYYGEEGSNSKICELIEENSALALEFHVGDFFPRLGWLSKLTGVEGRMKKTFKKWDELLDGVIDDHLRHGGGGKAEADQDLMDVLLSLRRQDQTLTMDHVKALIEDMFIAGTDTSYVTMQWVMVELIRNPKTMKKVQEEIRGIMGGKTKFEEDDISKMLYLKAVLKEVMRLHAPIPIMIPHESITTTHIAGYEIPAKTRLVINAWAIGRNSESWDEPEKFLPERFLDSTVDFTGHDFQFIPFGAGRRICPGMLLAVSTMELALATLLYHFDWSMPNGKSPEQLDISEAPGIALKMKSRLILHATARSNAT